MNDWMETHNFPEEAKVQRFCLTLTGEARLWYETLRPIEVDWTGLQEHFRQQYSDDSDGYESDRAVLQLMTAEADVHDNFDTARLTEESDYLNL